MTKQQYLRWPILTEMGVPEDAELVGPIPVPENPAIVEINILHSSRCSLALGFNLDDAISTAARIFKLTASTESYAPTFEGIMAKVYARFIHRVEALSKSAMEYF